MSSHIPQTPETVASPPLFPQVGQAPSWHWVAPEAAGRAKVQQHASSGLVRSAPAGPDGPHTGPCSPHLLSSAVLPDPTVVHSDHWPGSAAPQHRSGDHLGQPRSPGRGGRAVCHLPCPDWGLLRVKRFPSRAGGGEGLWLLHRRWCCRSA